MVNIIIPQTSVSISFQNAILAREKGQPASSQPKQAEANQKSLKKEKKSSRIKFVDTQASSSESEVPEDEDFSLRDEFPSERPMFATTSPSKIKADKLLVPDKINGISCKMELDTGASVTVIQEEM